MSDNKDWRLQGQEKYLSGVTLYYKKYIRYSDTWDHDHCEFCQVKFSLEDHSGGLDEGYATKITTHWICKRCLGAACLSPLGIRCFPIISADANMGQLARGIRG